MRLFYLTSILILKLSVVYCQSENLPAWFSDCFKKKELNKKFNLASFLSPIYLKEDFNGDKIQDIAVLITEKATKKKGILLIHGKSYEHFIFGAGQTFGNGGNDFKWADQWILYKKKKATETQFNKESGDIIGEKEITLQRPGILIENYEDGAALAGGIIYWNNYKYIWIQQGG